MSIVSTFKSLFQKNNTTCNHKNTFDTMFSIISDDKEISLIITVCVECKKVLQYHDIKKNSTVSLEKSIVDDIKYNKKKIDNILSVKNNNFIIMHPKSGMIKENLQFVSKDNKEGITTEDLLNTILVRLRNFQETNMNTSSTDEVIECLENALELLEKRHNDRKNRGVEGTYEK